LSTREDLVIQIVGLFRRKSIDFFSINEYECYKNIVEKMTFNGRIISLAVGVVEKMGGQEAYSCIHLRRTDKLMIPWLNIPFEIFTDWLNRSSYLLPKERVYIATDDPSFIAPFQEPLWTSKGTRIVFTAREFNELNMNETNDFLGCIEQQICSKARSFFHAAESSFSRRIVEMRQVEQRKSFNFRSLMCEEFKSWCFNRTSLERPVRPASRKTKDHDQDQF